MRERNPSNEQVLDACDSALLLVSYLHFKYLSEEPRLILESVKEYIGEEHSQLYANLKLANMLLAGPTDKSIVSALLN